MDLDLTAIVIRQERHQEVADPMISEIARDVAHAEPAIRVRLVFVDRPSGGEGFGMPFVPAAGLAQDRIRIGARIVNQGEGEIAVGVDEVGLEVESLSIVGDGLVDLPQVLQHAPQVDVCRRIAGFERQGSPVTVDRLIESPQPPEHVAQFRVSLGQIGRESHSAATAHGRFLHPAQLHEGMGQIDVRLGVVGTIAQGLFGALGGDVESAELQGHGAEQEQSIGLGRLDLQDRSVNRLGPRQIARLMEAETLLDSVARRHDRYWPPARGQDSSGIESGASTATSRAIVRFSRWSVPTVPSRRICAGRPSTSRPKPESRDSMRASRPSTRHRPADPAAESTTSGGPASRQRGFRLSRRIHSGSF
jgi:hypothetical protein